MYAMPHKGIFGRDMYHQNNIQQHENNFVKIPTFIY